MVVDEAELAEQKAREEDARIMAELPELKVPFVRAKWENDVSVRSARFCLLSF